MIDEARVIQHEEKEGTDEQGYWWLNAKSSKGWDPANWQVGQTQAYSLRNENGSRKKSPGTFVRPRSETW